MKKKIALGLVGVILVAILVLVGLVLVPSVFSSEPSYSTSTTLSILSGDVEIMKVDSETWETAKDGMTINAGDSAKTGADARALITFFDGTTMSLEPRTEVLISELYEVEGTGSTIVRLQQKAGETWNRVEKLADPACRYEVETPAGVGAVRGTTIGMVVGADGDTRMRVFEGSGSFVVEGVEVIIGEGMESGAEPGDSPDEASSIPLPDSMLRLSVHSPAWMNVVDPSGRSAGMVPPGIVVNQIPGAITSGYGVEPQFVEIPDPADGIYSIVLYGTDSGVASVLSEGYVKDGDALMSVLSEERECGIDDDEKRLFTLEAAVVGGVLDSISLSEMCEPLTGDEPGNVVVTEAALDGRAEELANSFDEKWEAFQDAVEDAVSGEEVVLIFTEDEVTGKIAHWASGPDSPVELYSIEINLEDGVAKGKGRFTYSVVKGKASATVRLEIEDNEPKVKIDDISFDAGVLPLPANALKGRINEEADKINWDIDADLISVEIANEQVVLTVIKH